MSAGDGVKRIVNKRNGKVGWRFRFTDPRTGKPTHKHIHVGERREAERVLRGFLEDLERQKFGLADHTCWNVAFGDLVGRFLRENGFPSEARRKRLACDLARNPLKIAMAADMNGRAALTEKCLRLARERGSVFVRKHV